MSYCVNCGVRLESSIKKCPLCNTPVINPNELEKEFTTHSFAKDKGQLEKAKRKDWGLLLTVVLTATAFSCGLLNALVFRGNMWSLLIIGVCILIWVLAFPTVIYTKTNVYFSLLFDGFAVAIYLYMISYITPTKHWFFFVGLPITLLITILAVILAILYKKVSTSLLANALYIFIEIPILCMGIEILVRYILYAQL